MLAFSCWRNLGLATVETGNAGETGVALEQGGDKALGEIGLFSEFVR